MEYVRGVEEAKKSLHPPNLHSVCSSSLRTDTDDGRWCAWLTSMAMKHMDLPLREGGGVVLILFLVLLLQPAL